MKPIPTVNVNLAQCTCRYRTHDQGPDDHPYPCPAKLVPIPCPIPRSVTFEVRLGACACFKRNYVAPDRDSLGHADHCPARPIRVSCSISGKAWEESTVEECDPDHVPVADFWGMVRAVEARWALVKALVTGESPFVQDSQAMADAVMLLIHQRAAVFTALGDMARLEDAHAHARQRAYDALDESGHAADSEHMRARAKARDSVNALAAYVDRLIERVGVL